MKTTRRELFGLSAAAGMAAFTPAAAAAVNDSGNELTLGVASYSLRNFSRSGAIKALKALNIKYVNVKDVHLPMRSTPEEVKTAIRDFSKEKIQILGCGNVSFRKRVGPRPADLPAGEAGDEKDPRPEISITDEEMKRNFEYAKMLGAPVM